MEWDKSFKKLILKVLRNESGRQMQMPPKESHVANK